MARLKRISNGRQEWQIGSYPGTGSKVERLTNGQVGEAKREVFARDISGRVRDESEVESERQLEWMEQVVKDTSQVVQPIELRMKSLKGTWKSYVPQAIQQ